MLTDISKPYSFNWQPCSFQTHPNVDKKLFTADSVIALKNPEKSFPLNNDVGVLKWRLQTTDESLIPLTSECWLQPVECTFCACTLKWHLLFFNSKLLAFREW